MPDFGNPEYEDRTMACILRLSVVGLFYALVCGCAGAPPTTEKGENCLASDEKTNEKAGVRAGKDADDEVEPDVRLLKEAKIGTADDELIAYLKRHSESDDDLLHMDRLIRQLGDEDFDKREAASTKIVNLGLVSLALLREARKNDSKELARRAKDCGERIEKDSEVNLPLVAIRVLARHKAVGASEALLRYLPFVIDEAVEEEVYYGLDGLAVKDRKVDPLLVTALKDALPARRAVAACILGRVGDEAQKAEVRKLLDDKESLVRLRAAQGLLASKDHAAIPTLCELLEARATSVSWQAAELLNYVAGDTAPDPIPNGDEGDPRKRRQSWETWRKKQSVKINLPKPTARPPGLFLTCGDVYHDGNVSGAVGLYGCGKTPHWTLTDLPDGIRDAQLLPGGRFLLAEQEKNRVTERDLKGNVLWSQRVQFGAGQAMCQRLPTGRTFIWCGSDWVHLDESGNESRPDFEHVRGLRPGSGERMSNGNVITLSAKDSLIIELNPLTGERIRKITIDRTFTNPIPDMRSNVMELPNGRFLVIVPRHGRLLVVSNTGKIDTTFVLPELTFDVRQLRSGHFLAANGQPVTAVVRLGADGEELSKIRLPYCPVRVRPCLTLISLGFD
jgi:HEAT repeat protein